MQIQGEGLITAATASSVRTGAVASARSYTSAAAAATVAAAAAATSGPKYKGLFSAMTTISREEGVRALYSGLAPGLQRQMAFASVRIGLYDAVKQGYGKMLQVDPNQKNIGLRILAGITTGGAAVVVAQPTDVVKVRMQAQSKANPRYTSTISAYRTIAIKEGARGLWRGCLPNVSRNAVVNCTELVSYDLIKETLLQRQLLSDNIPCHFLSAVGAGFFTTLFASPIDVVKTRFMNSSNGQYKGALDCAVKMYKEAGFRGFYKGCVPAFLRFGPWNVVMFISYEQLKKQFMKFNNVESSKPHGAPKKPLPAIEIKQSNSSRFM